MSGYMWCVIALLGWMRFRQGIQNRAYHHPESETAQLSARCLHWLRWGVFLWVIFAYLESLFPTQVIGSFLSLIH